MATVMRRYGTGYTRTTVLHADDGGYLWVRRPGPDRAPIGLPDQALRETLRLAHAGPVTLTLPDPEPAGAYRGAAVYRVGGARTVAEALLTGVEEVPGILRNAAGALAAVHQNGSTAADRLPAPPGPRRLLAWLRGGSGSRSAARLHADAVSVLGRRRIETAMRWCAELLTGRGVLLHGAPGTGILVRGGQDGSGWLLIGEHLAVGSAESDLGWLAGELVEHRETRPQLDYDGLIAAFLNCYPSEVDLSLVGRVAAARYLTHAHDFSAYVGWHDQLTATLRRLPGVIDAAEHGTLLPRMSPV